MEEKKNPEFMTWVDEIMNYDHEPELMTIEEWRERHLNAPQPPPEPNRNPAVWALVIKDMADRNAVGAQKYGTVLQPFNGRDPLVDAYQEALDLVVYLRQAIYERDE